MVTIATTTAPESREDALIRLADQARTSGVKLFQDRADGRFYASSRSQPGTYHRLSGFSCSCQGFIRHGRCSHLAALHSALGWLDPEPETPSPASCSECHGAGTVTGTVACGRSWRYDDVPCMVCHGGVSRPDHQHPGAVARQIRNIDLSAVSIELRLDPDQRYAVHRDVWLDEDIDGTWFVGVVRPEEPEIRGDRTGGSTRVNDPAVTGFLRELFALLADPDHCGDRDMPAPSGTGGNLGRGRVRLVRWHRHRGAEGIGWVRQRRPRR